MEQHVSLNSMLAKANEWALLSTLGCLEIPERLERLEKMLLEHALHYDDLGSNKLAGYIVTTVTDEQLLPFVTRVAKNGEFLELDQKKWKEIQEASRTAVVNRARKAMELFPKLPVFKPVKSVGWRGDFAEVRCESTVETQTLVKTKETLLLEVASGWRVELDKDKADEFFDFFLEAELHHNDEKMRAEVLRKISDAGFPAYKLAHTIARFQNELRGDKKEIVDILAHGLIKSSQREDLIGMFFAVEPLWGSIETPSNFGSKASSAEAFDFVQRAAKFIRAVDDRVQQMLAKVGKYGCTIEYPEQSQGMVPTVNLTYHEEVRDASSGNKSFERKRDEIRKWLEGNRDNPRLRINIYYIGKDCGKILAEREDTLY